MPAAGLYDPALEVGCTIIGSTGMHMRLASTADAVTLNAEATGYTVPFPVPGHDAQMQSNMAATSISIGCWIWLSACSPARASPDRAPT
jgi:hypothetical protein